MPDRPSISPFGLSSLESRLFVAAGRQWPDQTPRRHRSATAPRGSWNPDQESSDRPAELLRVRTDESPAAPPARLPYRPGAETLPYSGFRSNEHTEADNRDPVSHTPDRNCRARRLAT